MSKFMSIINDRQRRAGVMRVEFYRCILLVCLNDFRLIKKFRLFIYLILLEYLKRIAKFRSMVRNRCIVTGRARAIYSYFGLSRYTFREFARRGLLNGLEKFSW